MVKVCPLAPSMRMVLTHLRELDRAHVVIGEADTRLLHLRFLGSDERASERQSGQSFRSAKNCTRRLIAELLKAFPELSQIRG